MAQSGAAMREAHQRIAELERALDRLEGDMLDLIADNEELRAELRSMWKEREQELRVKHGLHLRVA